MSEPSSPHQLADNWVPGGQWMGVPHSQVPHPQQQPVLYGGQNQQMFTGMAYQQGKEEEREEGREGGKREGEKDGGRKGS